MKAHGKVILSGEHSAVYDQPAVVCGVNLDVDVGLVPQKESLVLAAPLNNFYQNARRIFTEKFQPPLPLPSFEVHISGQLPWGKGLGYSAALAHAFFKSFAAFSSLHIPAEEMISAIQENEKLVHGHAGVLDALGTVMGGVVKFQRSGEEFTFQSLPTKNISTEPFFLIDSGRPVESTRTMITFLKRKLEDNPALFDVIENIGKVTKDLIHDLENEKFNPAYMTENEALLEELGIVGETAMKMIGEIEKIGGSAKITGASGIEKGSGIILASHPDTEKFTSFVQQHGWTNYQVNLGNI